MMKWITYFCAFSLTFLIGYFLGGQQAVSPSTPPSDAINETAISSPQPKSSAPFSQEFPLADCQCYQQDKAETVSSSSSSLFERLLAQQKYAEAMELLATLSRISQEDGQSLTRLFISHINQLLSARPHDFPRIDEAINLYLAEFYNDINILMLLVQSKTNQGQYHEAINQLQLAYSYAYTEQHSQITQRYYQAFTQTIESALGSPEERGKLIELYLSIADAGFLAPKQQLRLIELYLIRQDYYKAGIYAEALERQSQWEAPIAALYQQYGIERQDEQTPAIAQDAGSSIALKQIDNQFVAPVELSQQPTALLIDTGASVTTITRDYYESIKRSVNMTYEYSQQFLTASGRTRGDIYRLDELHIGDYVLRDISIAVLNYPSSQHSSGLLGMNVLRHFRFEIDQANSRLNLTPN